MTTLADLETRHSIDILDHLDRTLTVPILSGPQAQGDLIVLPTNPNGNIGQPVPAQGIAVLRGQAMGNTHTLIADGPVTWAPATPGGQDLGVVTVPDGATAWLAHPEHGYTGIAPGIYTIRRQREMVDELRLVAD